MAAIGYGSFALITLAFFAARDNDDLKSKWEAYGLKIPGLDAPYRNFALYRMAITLSMTHEAGMRADEAVTSSFRASANLAYQKHGRPTAELVHDGMKIRRAIGKLDKNLFPRDYLDSLAVGEESGQISEVMNRVADNYRDEAIVQTKRLANIAGGVVYAMVGLFVIVCIIRIAMSIGGVYQDAIKGL